MSENLEFFRETAERILADTVGTAEIEAAEERCAPKALLDALRENGILTMLAPEEQGGIDATLFEAMAIMRAAGYAAAPGPVLETLLGQALLGRAGITADGAPLALALMPDGIGARPELFDISWAEAVEHVLVIMPQEDGIRVSRTPRSAWSIEKGTDAAGEPRDHLHAQEMPVCETFDLPIPFQEVLRQASLLRAAQMLGATEWSFQRSVEYAMERQQFGHEIGKFQAVQQMLAELADHVLASTVILEAAGTSDSLMLAAAARARLADATDAAIAISHQVHGAIGFSREYALNHRTKRLMAWRNDYGSIPYWRRTLGRNFLSHSRETLWPAVADAGSELTDRP